MLEVRNLSVRYGHAEILRDVSFSVAPGQWWMIVGPNGAGKSTIVRALAQNAPYTGTILLNGENARRLSPARRARDMGILMQNHALNYAFTVDQIVRLGRYAHGGFLSSRAADDEARVDEALRLTGLTAQRHQSALTVSGGELQRAFLAQLMCQNPRLMVLDEPANHLDLKYQKEIFSLVRAWLNEPGRAVISVVHDLSMARALGTHALLISQGRVMALGRADQVLTNENLNAVYEMDVAAWMRGLLGQWQ